MNVDAVLAAFLAHDILLVEASERLPLPPIAPSFATETVRPGKASS